MNQSIELLMLLRGKNNKSKTFCFLQKDFSGIILNFVGNTAIKKTFFQKIFMISCYSKTLDAKEKSPVQKAFVSVAAELGFETESNVFFSII